MIILVVNAGSSSLKYQLIDMKDESVIAKGNCDRIGIDGHISHKTLDGRTLNEDCDFPTHTEAFMKLVDVLTKGDASVIRSMDEISAVGHRIVQGAEIFDKPVLVTDEVIQQIDDLKELAGQFKAEYKAKIGVDFPDDPKEQLMGAIKAVFRSWDNPHARQRAPGSRIRHCLPPDHAGKGIYVRLPYEDYENYSVRKYGFHGTSHRFVSNALAQALGKDIKDLKIVSCHLGNGSSITAVQGGKSIDTSMGFTPLDGLLMGTRTGCVDHSAVTFVYEKHHFTPSQMSEYMNKKSGFLGVSGISSDNRDITAAAEKGDKRALLAKDILVYEIKKYIGSYAAAMNGLDAVLFTGGIWENSDDVRAEVCRNMDFFGIKLDEEANNGCRGQLKRISAPDSRVEVWIVPTNEELLIARDTLSLISK